MKKQIVAIIGSVVVVLALAGGLVWWQASQQNSAKNVDQATQQDMPLTAPKDACSYFTQEIAVKILGEGAEKGSDGSPVASEDVSVSTCIFTSKQAQTIAEVKNMRTATLLMRSPLTTTGAVSNDEPFDNLETGAIKVEGYGEKAFWSPTLGQLNVLKGGTWLILSVGKSDLSQSTLDDAKKFADEIIPQL